MKEYTAPNIETIEIGNVEPLADSQQGKISKDGNAIFSEEQDYPTTTDTWNEAL